MSGPILNVADALVTRELAHGEKFAAKIAPITGTLRYGKQEFPVRAGDVVGCPPGADATFPGRYVPDGESLEYRHGE